MGNNDTERITMKKVSNFTTIDTIYGKWIVSRSAAYHAETMIKTGVPVHPELAELMVSIINTLPNNCIVYVAQMKN